MRKPRVRPWAMPVLCTGIAGLSTVAWAQASPDVSAQESFQVAIARAHARSSLYSGDTTPFQLHSEAVSHFALHGTGRLSYTQQWVSSRHWSEVLSSNDGSTTRREVEVDGVARFSVPFASLPFRMRELRDLSHVYLPPIEQAARYVVAQSTTRSPSGETLTCYATTGSTSTAVFSRNQRWCFSATTGLLKSEDLLIGTHIVYSAYIPFQGRQVFTHVTATAGNVQVLDIHLQYGALDPAALDAVTVPSPAEERIKELNLSEAMGYGAVTAHTTPALPASAPATDSGVPVGLRIALDSEGHLRDATVENAPDAALAEAALRTVPGMHFRGIVAEGKPTAAWFIYPVYFSRAPQAAAEPQRQASGPVRLDQMRAIRAELGMPQALHQLVLQQKVADRGKFPSYWPQSVIDGMYAAMESVDAASISLPFYQQCYSAANARLLVDLFATPEGRAYGESVDSFEQLERRKGVSPEQSRRDAMNRNTSLDPHALDRLDAQDQRQARELFIDRKAEVTACVGRVQSGFNAALVQAQLAAAKAYIAGHRDEIQAAEAAAGKTSSASQ